MFVGVFDGVTVLVGVLDGVTVLVGVLDGVTVLVGVNEIVGVFVGDKEGEGGGGGKGLPCTGAGFFIKQSTISQKNLLLKRNLVLLYDISNYILYNKY